MEVLVSPCQVVCEKLCVSMVDQSVEGQDRRSHCSPHSDSTFACMPGICYCTLVHCEDPIRSQL